MMKTYVLLAFLGLLVCLASAKRGSITRDLFEDDMKDDEHAESDVNEPVDGERRKSPCFSKKCRRGETCILRGEEAKCVCTPDCSYYTIGDGRYKVCSNRNVTYQTECHLDQDHCLCKRNQDGCSNPGTKKIQLEYYGECQDLTPCRPEDAQQFPKRMRDWLFVVMEEMARRAEIGEYMDLLDKAAHDESHAYAVIWKFCDLDTDPQDRVVSRRELQYTVRSLRAMEHCLMPFLDDCDEDDNRDITLQEWGKCLGLEQRKITDKCLDIHKHKNRQK